jgi:hypothetical protein
LLRVIGMMEIPIRWHSGRPQYELVESLSVDRRMICSYLALAAGMAPGGR